MERGTTCCFTGHRTIQPPDMPVLHGKIRQVIMDLYDKGFVTFITGGAIGFDTVAAEVVLELRREFPDIRLVLAIPMPSQPNRFSAEDKVRYFNILEQCDEKHVLSDVSKRDVYYLRNRWMVDNSGFCVAYLRDNKGGTYYTCDYAGKCGVEVLHV